jgi:hypothetical protein
MKMGQVGERSLHMNPAIAMAVGSRRPWCQLIGDRMAKTSFVEILKGPSFHQLSEPEVKKTRNALLLEEFGQKILDTCSCGGVNDQNTRVDVIDMITYYSKREGLDVRVICEDTNNPPIVVHEGNVVVCDIHLGYDWIRLRLPLLPNISFVQGLDSSTV